MLGCMGGIAGTPMGMLGWPGGIDEGVGTEVLGVGARGRVADTMEGGIGGRDAAAAMDCGVGA